MPEPARFHQPPERFASLAPPALPRGFWREFLADGRTPARALTDQAVRLGLPYLEGPGEIVELGAAGGYYRAFADPGQAYRTSNLDGTGDLLLDMTALDLADASVDALVSILALEHVYEYERTLSESLRCLRPGGRMLLVVPFMYYFHAAPEDYFRFTAPALDRLLADWRVDLRMPLGGRELLVAEMYHEKQVMGSARSVWGRRWLRLLALAPLLGAGWARPDPAFAFAHMYLCRKPA